MRYRGRSFSEEEIENIKKIIEEAPVPKSRRYISRKICEKFNWIKPDGGLKDMACRVALLQMEKDEVIKLPPPLRPKTNGARDYSKELKPEIISLECSLRDLEIKIILVDPSNAKLWNIHMAHFHYLGYTKLGGAQLRYIVMDKESPIAFFGFSAAAWKVKDRDDFIGWTPSQKEKNLHLIVNNSRFLILPSIRVPHLASHLLSKIVSTLKKDWFQRYKCRPVLLETFVQKDRFNGTSYKAANWKYLGDTKGRGKYDFKNKKEAPVKTIWVYPLEKKLNPLLIE